jgi:hypothetical protein
MKKGSPNVSPRENKESSPRNMEKFKKDSDNTLGKSTIKKITSTTKNYETSQKNKNEDKSNSDKSTQSHSLVKYDTPFLVSTTLSNKKELEELDDSNEKAEIFLRNLINKKSDDGKGSEVDDYSVKDALNKILPPKKIYKNDQLWVQYVSCTPVTKAEVHNLQEGLDRRLQTMQARETGICPIREQLYNECFDELIRQVTINCLERGILLMRVKKEVEMTINSYQTLYESSIAYGIRTSLIVKLILFRRQKKQSQKWLIKQEA